MPSLTIPMASASESVLQDLRAQLSRTSPQRLSQTTVSTGLPLLDRQLPGHGLPSASVIEWVADGPGLRTTSLALKCGAALMHKAGALAVIDPYDDFHAAALTGTGIDLSRLLLVRPSESHAHSPSSMQANRNALQIATPAHTGGHLSSADRSNTLWALEQVSRCPGVRLAVCWIDRLSSTVQRRLQLAVERSGVTVFLIRPATALSQPSWADLRFHLKCSQKMSDVDVGHSNVQLKLVKTRNSITHNGELQLDWNHETGAVREISELAHSGSSLPQSEQIDEPNSAAR